MTPMIKAPDPGVVKSLAKALRKNLPETVKLPHSKALEIAANSFGFSNWHACRTHFDRLNAGAFAPPANPDMAKDLAVALIRKTMDPVDRTLKLLSGELRTFRSGPVEVAGGISCGRSLRQFLAPLLELGARLDEALLSSRSGHLIEATEARRLSPHVNTMSPVPEGLTRMAGGQRLLIGCADATLIYDLPDLRVPELLKRGLLRVKGEKPDWVVDLDQIQKRLREASRYPHPEATFAVSSNFLTAVMCECQARINDATTPEPDLTD